MILLSSKNYISFIGRYLSPILVMIIFAMLFLSLRSTDVLIGDKGIEPLKTGFLNGYNTQDLIAAFFFSSNIYSYLIKSKRDHNAIRYTLISGALITAILLSFVYMVLIYVSANHSFYLKGIGQGELFISLCKMFFGPNLGFISAIFMVVACMTTSVALVHTLSTYMQDTFKVTYKLALLVSILVCFIISCFGIDAITHVSQPVLMWLYPILILISVLSIFR